MPGDSALFLKLVRLEKALGPTPTPSCHTPWWHWN